MCKYPAALKIKSGKYRMIDASKNILVLAAMKQELDAFIEPLDVQSHTLGPFLYYYAKLKSGNMVYCVLCGAGKVNAAAVASAFLSQAYMNIGFVLNTGTAGSLSRDVHKGDIVVGIDYCQHDYDLTTLFDNFKVGQMVGKENILDVVPRGITDAMPREEGVYFGTILSGDRFVSSGIRIDHTTPLAVDMESAAISHLCYHLYNVPFVAIRVITDNADENAQEDWHSLLERLSHKAAAYSHLVLNCLFSVQNGS